jgi:hypothetical protein
MDATIAAALIGGGALIVSGGWTALVAITSTRSARRTNQATLNAAADNTARALDAAREDRIWDKRADAYTDVLYVVRNRQERRNDATRTIRLDQETEDRRKEWLASLKLPDEVSVEMRLLAYASDPVLAAARIVGKANADVENAYLDWVSLSGEARSAGPDAPSGERVIEAHQALQAAVAKSDGADDALLDAIRADLHSRPSQVAVPPAATSSAPTHSGQA